MTTRLRIVLVLGLGLGLVGLMCVRRVRASCVIGDEVLTLTIRDIAVDGAPQALDAYLGTQVEMTGNGISVLLKTDGHPYAFFRSAICGYTSSNTNLQPTPPATAAPCAPAGLHCHWPDAAPLCSGRCAAGSWEVNGCSAP